MSAFLKVCSLALRPTAEGALDSLGIAAGHGAVDLVANWLFDRFSASSGRLTAALGRANAKAWSALEFALGGESLWQRCTAMFGGADDRELRRQVRAFLDSLPAQSYPGDPDAFRGACLAELRLARKENMLAVGVLDVRMLARRAGAFAAFADPAALLEAEARALAEMAEDLPGPRFASLRLLLGLRPAGGSPPVLAAAARFFFRREVESDPELFRGLVFSKVEDIAAGQRAGFAALHDALAAGAGRAERLLDLAERTHDEVLQIKAAVNELLERHRLAGRELRSADSLSIRSDDERRVVRELVKRWRALPEHERGRADLLNGLGMAQAAAGDFAAARADFAAAAAAAPDNRARAEARHNAFRAALEQRDFAAALAELVEAVRLDPARFAPFPFDKYRPEAILGAGGFGTAFRCRDTDLDKSVVVKALAAEGLDRDVASVFAEARALDELEHPNIIRLRHCGWADPAAKARPYLVTDLFAGSNLEELVRTRGPIAVGDLAGLMTPVAEGLAAAHARGVLHRDIKPANILAARDGARWKVKLIDFGLAYKPGLLHSVGSDSGRTLMGAGIAGTIGYAAPEQMGALAAAVGPASDVYGFGRTCCFALFGNPDPTYKDYKRIPESLAELLGDCIAHRPEQRPADFGVLLDRLRSLDQARAPAEPPPLPPPPPSPPPPQRSQATDPAWPSMKGAKESEPAWPSMKVEPPPPPKPPPPPTPPKPPRSTWEPSVRNLAAQGRKIEAIKLFREMTGAGLAEAKNAVEAMIIADVFKPTAGGVYVPAGGAGANPGAGAGRPPATPGTAPAAGAATAGGGAAVAAPDKRRRRGGCFFMLVLLIVGGVLGTKHWPDIRKYILVNSQSGSNSSSVSGGSNNAGGSGNPADPKAWAVRDPGGTGNGGPSVKTAVIAIDDSSHEAFVAGSWRVTGWSFGDCTMTFNADGTFRLQEFSKGGSALYQGRFRITHEGAAWIIAFQCSKDRPGRPFTDARYFFTPSGDNSLRITGRNAAQFEPAILAYPYLFDGFKEIVFDRTPPLQARIGPYQTHWEPHKH